MKNILKSILKGFKKAYILLFYQNILLYLCLIYICYILSDIILFLFEFCIIDAQFLLIVVDIK